MRAWSVERLGALAGVGFIVLNLIANFIVGSPPKFDDSPAEIASFFQDHHRSVIVGVILTGIASPLFAWLAITLALRLRAVGEAAWAAVVFGLAIAAVALGTASDALYGSLARIGTEGDNGLIQGLYQISGFMAGKAFWFAAGAILATGIVAWRALPRWYAWMSLAAAVLLGIGGISVRNKGFLAPGNGMVLIAFLGLMVWVLATGLMLWRMSAEVEPVPAAQTSPV
jgi:hypothetical protein